MGTLRLFQNARLGSCSHHGGFFFVSFIRFSHGSEPVHCFHRVGRRYRRRRQDGHHRAGSFLRVLHQVRRFETTAGRSRLCRTVHFADPTLSRACLICSIPLARNSLFFAPIFASIPSNATGSVLVIVGSMMARNAAEIVRFTALSIHTAFPRPLLIVRLTSNRFAPRFYGHTELGICGRCDPRFLDSHHDPLV